MAEATTGARQLLRHCLATVAYRGGKTLRDAHASFASYRCGETSRTPAQILAHVGDLFDWALSMAKGKQVWHDSKPLAWPEEVNRFFASLKAFDDYLAGSDLCTLPPKSCFKGPSLTR